MDGEGERGGAVTGERSGDQGRKGRVLGEQGHFYKHISLLRLTVFLRF